MALSYSTLRAAAARPTAKVAKSATEAKRSGYKTAFLCHSHADRVLVEGFENYVKQMGWYVYIDWLDTTLPDVPDRHTALKIKTKIEEADLFIFLATHNSVRSRWCPWEIGYADGVKPIERILIVQTQSDDGTYYGNEYLQLYRKLDTSSEGPLAVFEPGAVRGIYATSL